MKPRNSSLKKKGLKRFRFRELCPEIQSTTYLTHGIHSYTAKFIPQIPRFFIKKYCEPGSRVLDPFCGSGTTLLEAKALGCHAFGVDISPLARLIAKTKTTLINPERLSRVNQKINKRLRERVKLTYDVDFPNKTYWFHPKAIFQLRKIFSVIDEFYDAKIIDKNLKDFYLACASSIIRKSSYADPENPKTYCSPRMRLKRENQIPTEPIKYFLKAIEENYHRMKEAYTLLSDQNSTVEFLSSNDTRNLNMQEKVDLIVTSPPYANAQEYFRNIKLELFWLKLADPTQITGLDKKQIGGENHAAINYKQLHLTKIPIIDRVIKKIYDVDMKRAYIVYKYFYNMDKCLFEYSRVLKKKGHLVIIIGNNSVRGQTIPIHKGLIEIAKSHGFRLHELGYDLIRNRVFMTKRKNTAAPISRDWVIDLVKT